MYILILVPSPDNIKLSIEHYINVSVTPLQCFVVKWMGGVCNIHCDDSFLGVYY